MARKYQTRIKESNSIWRVYFLNIVMVNNKLKKKVKNILESADIRINGDRPWDIQVHNEQLYSRVLSQGSFGLGESYMDSWWDSEQLDETITKILSAELEKKVKPLSLAFNYLKAKCTNLQSKSHAFEIGQKHYDIGNDLYERMLDKRMTYTCGYWKNASTLEEAQDAKLDLICRKIGLKKGDHVWDIGGGWGSFARFAAEKYGASVVATTISKEQMALGQKKCEGLPVEFRLEDYRETKGMFDHIVSVGMVEHVGYKNYRAFMKRAYKNLKDGGFFLLHTIGSLRSVKNTDPWISKYIFPKSMLPSLSQAVKAAEKLFVIEDVHNFGVYYDKTLMTWFHNFDST